MSARTLNEAFRSNFLGNSPDWYKTTIVCFLIINPILYLTAGPFHCGLGAVFEFIFTLAMALKCYPLQPGGLLGGRGDRHWACQSGDGVPRG